MRWMTAYWFDIFVLVSVVAACPVRIGFRPIPISPSLASR